VEPLRLPTDLRPADGCFASGPAEARPEAVAAPAEAAPTYFGTSQRNAGVRPLATAAVDRPAARLPARSP
jgi:phosphoserine aminotransferase